jgi:hypothetical protein
MAIKHEGNSAPYKFDIECRWCTGAGAGTLGSKSFGSCVGLVLYSPIHRIGVVAHYAGSLGNPKYIEKAKKDTLEILRDVCPISPGIWKAWVFGGVSLNPKSEHSTSTVQQTKALINAIRQELKTNQYIPVNLLRKNPEYQEPEMQDAYVGHSEVSLDLATGKVTWG